MVKEKVDAQFIMHRSMVKLIVKGANNDFYYAVINDGKLQPSTFIAHEAGDRTAEERAFLNEAKTERKMYMLNSDATRAQQAIPRKAISASTAEWLRRI